MKSKYKGIIYILCAAFCFALMNAFVRLSGDLPSLQKAFFRNLVALIFAFVIIRKDRIKIEWKQGDGKYLFWRALFGTLGVFFNFYAVDHLVLSDASMLNKMSPFFAIVFSYLILTYLYKKRKLLYNNFYEKKYHASYAAAFALALRLLTG